MTQIAAVARNRENLSRFRNAFRRAFVALSLSRETRLRMSPISDPFSCHEDKEG